MAHSMDRRDPRFALLRCGALPADDAFYLNHHEVEVAPGVAKKQIRLHSYLSREHYLRGFDLTPEELIGIDVKTKNVLLMDEIYKEKEKGLNSWAQLYHVFETLRDETPLLRKKATLSGVKIPGWWRDHALRSYIYQLCSWMCDNEPQLSANAPVKYGHWPRYNDTKRSPGKEIRLSLMDVQLSFTPALTSGTDDEMTTDYALINMTDLVVDDISQLTTIGTAKPSSQDLDQCFRLVKLDALKAALASECSFDTAKHGIRYQVDNGMGGKAIL